MPDNTTVVLPQLSHIGPDPVAPSTTGQMLSALNSQGRWGAQYLAGSGPCGLNLRHPLEHETSETFMLVIVTVLLDTETIWLFDEDILQTFSC